MSTDAPTQQAVNLELDKLVEAGQAVAWAAWMTELKAAGEDCYHRFTDDRTRSVTLTFKCTPKAGRQGLIEGEFFVTSKFPAQNCGSREFKVSKDGTVRATPDDDKQGQFKDIDRETGEVLTKEIKDGSASSVRISK